MSYLDTPRLHFTGQFQADVSTINNEVAFYDVFVGFIAFLVGIFVGGALYARAGMKRAVLVSLLLMAVLPGCAGRSVPLMRIYR